MPGDVDADNRGGGCLTLGFGSDSVGLSVGVDAANTQYGDVLTMAVAAAAVLPASLLENDDLVEAVLRNNGRGDGSVGYDRRTQGQVAVDAHRQHVGEGDGAAGFGVQFLDLQNRVGGNAILFPAGADDSEHGTKLSDIAILSNTGRKGL